MGANANTAIGPALITINSKTGVLQSWPIHPGGGNNPQKLTGPLGSGYGNMVGNGHVVALTSQYPSEVIFYNFDTQRERKLPDPYGVPIDIAIDKNAALYALNAATQSNVAMYPAGSHHATELVCKIMTTGEAIAVDNEGDIFINGYTRAGGAGVVEIPNGPGGPEPQNCVKLDLKSQPGYVAGLAVDPKTDDLVVLDDPDDCAGGIEGRMTIYPKPYSRTTGVSHDLGANCAGTMRLSSDSTIVFVGDQDVSGSFSFILQRSFPDGRGMGSYHGGSPSGFTTIPNTLPN